MWREGPQKSSNLPNGRDPLATFDSRAKLGRLRAKNRGDSARKAQPAVLNICEWEVSSPWDFPLHPSFLGIVPFQDGNGRVGRLIMLKECLTHDVVPFVITDDMKSFYYRGLSKWDKENGYLLDTCLIAQDKFKATLDYFRIAYGEN